MDPNWVRDKSLIALIFFLRDEAARIIYDLFVATIFGAAWDELKNRFRSVDSLKNISGALRLTVNDAVGSFLSVVPDIGIHRRHCQIAFKDKKKKMFE